jgi:hypothetical protein
MGDRVHAAATARGDDDRRREEANRVVDEERRSDTRGDPDTPQKSHGPRETANETIRRAFDDAGLREFGGQDHHAEEQREGTHVDRSKRRVGGDGPAEDHEHRPEQRAGGPSDGQPRHRFSGHQDPSEGEDDQRVSTHGTWGSIPSTIYQPLACA